MSGSAIAPVFALGPRITAQVLGLPMTLYRCNGVGPVIASVNVHATLPAWVTADPQLMASKPLTYKTPLAYAAVDPALTLPGDYLVGAVTLGGATETFFIASQDVPAPIQVVRCNRALTVSRPGAGAPGPNYYGGDLTASETLLLTAWPAAVADKGRRQAGETALPGDMDLPWCEIFLPPTIPVQIRPSDVMLDDQVQPVRYVVSGVEQTPFGWRLLARFAVP